MKLEQQQSEYLKQWMVKKLKPICDADHEVLSEYVMALLRHNQSENELRISCLKQLDDFLQRDTKLFVTELFDHLRAFGAFNGSYQPPEIDLSTPASLRKRSLAIDEPAQYIATKDRPVVSQQSPTASIPQYTPTQSHPSFLLFPEQQPQSNHLATHLPTFPSSSQVQPYNPNNPNPQQRNPKRPRKSICRDYHYRGYCARGNTCHFSHDDSPSSSSTLSTGYLSKAQSTSESEPPSGPPPPPGSCIPLVCTNPSIGVQQIPGLGGPLPISYDLPTPSFSSHHQHRHQHHQHQHHQQSSSSPPRVGQSNHRHYNNSSHPDRSSSRFEGTSSSSTPFHKKSSSGTTLVIENVPPTSLSELAVREYFSTFGEIISTQIDLYNSQAQVTFKLYEDAKRAYSSPEPVFNNRFVRIHFRKRTFTNQNNHNSDNNTTIDTSTPINTTSSGPPRRSFGHPTRNGTSPTIPIPESFTNTHHQQTSINRNETNSNGYQHSQHKNTYDNPPSSFPPPPAQSVVKPIDNVQLLSQREQELRSKIDAQKLLLEQLQMKKIAQKSNIQKVDGPNDTQKPQNNIVSELENQESISNTNPLIDPSSASDPLNQQQQQNEPPLSTPKEALSPLIPESNHGFKRSPNSTVYSNRGMSNGRKLINSRTSWTPTGALSLSSSSTGTTTMTTVINNNNPNGITTSLGSSTTAKTFKIDNRSCTLAVTNLPSFNARETLKTYLEQFGTIVSVTPISLPSTDPNHSEEVYDVNVKFSSRSSAEKALASGMDIPEVGKVTMSWVGGSTNNNSTTSTSGHSFIPGLRNNLPPQHQLHPRSFSLVNHPPPSQDQQSPSSNSQLISDQKILDIVSSTNRTSSSTTNTTKLASSQVPLDNNSGDANDDFIDDFCVDDDEVDGCWKR
ncbi:hypothetical protein Pst134EA_009060 [Puccinia striiformis f. sp. tritici]|uniref:hypothetical protein n=1 Tax=Puccinia striiformis f. sp. tritici TaxID=168172 RepID=UPI002007FB43|nr:hypothetical protein Pst134EA_009060 [Puccinia striiformis f. sp. tritici]KAH9468520.1 hypothetical protein Pst134EA_009060 [Puccinia striiformis f. sp. tritici]